MSDSFSKCLFVSGKKKDILSQVSSFILYLFFSSYSGYFWSISRFSVCDSSLFWLFLLFLFSLFIFFLASVYRHFQTHVWRIFIRESKLSWIRNICKSASPDNKTKETNQNHTNSNTFTLEKKLVIKMISTRPTKTTIKPKLKRKSDTYLLKHHIMKIYLRNCSKCIVYHRITTDVAKRTK